MTTSSPGKGLQPKIRSINVEANLLAQWLETRQERSRSIRHWSIAGFGLLALIMVIFPPLIVQERGAVAALSQAQSVLQGVEKGLAEYRQEHEAIQPALKAQQRLVETRANTLNYLAQITQILNSAPAGVEFGTVKAALLSGELSLQVQAEAKDSGLAAQFVEQASQGEGMLSALQTSSQASQTLGARGVAFEFVKKVRL